MCMKVLDFVQREASVAPLLIIIILVLYTTEHKICFLYLTHHLLRGSGTVWHPDQIHVFCLCFGQGYRLKVNSLACVFFLMLGESCTPQLKHTNS